MHVLSYMDIFHECFVQPPNSQKSSIVPGSNLWTSPVSYVLDNDLNAKGVIMRAFDQFRVKSCIDFKPHDSEKYYLKIKKLDGCWSYVGRVFAYGQDLSIGARCDTLGIVEHELLHALGFYHEQSRYDRDNYVQIVSANILPGGEHAFRKVASDESTVHGTPYDYMSVLHYRKDAFTNGDGSTIITVDPKFQDVIGQRFDMSPTDTKELNLLYSCSECLQTFFCGFSDGEICNMNRRSTNENSWKVVTDVHGGPSSDHTSLPSGSQQKGYFIHASTASGQEGDSAKLETEVVKLNRGCNVQCLQFYYFHSGTESDELNIWIRDESKNFTPGSPTSHWKLHHVSLNATKPFQVVFEARKGAGSSTGGFSVDDINLSETECPHVFIQIDDLENRLDTSSFGTRIYSPRQYSKDGYAYRVAVILYKTYVGMYVQLLSGEFDDQLQWPCLQRQMIFQLLDQTPNQQLQMSKQRTFISTSGSSIWDNPRESGSGVFYENGELVYGGSLYGYSSFTTLEELQTREFLKGGTVKYCTTIFLIVFIQTNEPGTQLLSGLCPCSCIQVGFYLPVSFSYRTVCVESEVLFVLGFCSVFTELTAACSTLLVFSLFIVGWRSGWDPVTTGGETTTLSMGSLAVLSVTMR
uniref:Metalloendopeptidase n=1 Tax=Fundulus heteroclitus TaxID=8078 RepID=A0A3Q2QG24_FUNHE